LVPAPHGRGAALLPLSGRRSQDSPADERPARPLFEKEADVFAAALLMPAELMRREYAADREFFSMCDRFNVSQKAMSRRMHQVIPRQR